DLTQANEARRDALGAEGRQEIGAALAAYRRANELFGALGEQVARLQAEEIGIEEQALGEALEQASRAPAEIVAGPGDAARRLLTGARPPQHGALVAALRDARTRVAAAIAEAALFAEARAAEADAASLRERVRALCDVPGELAPGERLIAQARSAL